MSVLSLYALAMQCVGITAALMCVAVADCSTNVACTTHIKLTANSEQAGSLPLNAVLSIHYLKKKTVAAATASTAVAAAAMQPLHKRERERA
eukprot:9981-Heterococcus_DN1.PRE.5